MESFVLERDKVSDCVGLSLVYLLKRTRSDELRPDFFIVKPADPEWFWNSFYGNKYQVDRSLLGFFY